MKRGSGCIEQVCISHGARPALYFALLSADCKRRICGLFTPAFPPLFDIIKDAGFELFVTEIPSNLDVDELSTCFERLSGGVFLLNNPHNPTGRVAGASSYLMAHALGRTDEGTLDGHSMKQAMSSRERLTDLVLNVISR
ncbi:aminotransferase class I/II-fold pyridoxal phosphate-dependent enzyme [uncultured Pelagimonas sp.]|uniref:aminotransferase class I/II-fold pyridoxal phosphate-dependent enzyme n=1 Tax=uncultured Pelagimonas sp. TaxID=1618102 RepID=UPI002620E03B|nr:aminotransferase class I/II-fold pyridoxal phosphate-dependent enzyme [uncultured Pelagimonas sp.]